MVNDGFRLFPEQATAHAAQVDALYIFLTLISTFFTVLIAGLIVYFAIKYRRGNRKVDRTLSHGHGMAMEISWIVIPGLICLIIFGWSASLYFSAFRAPAGAISVQVVGKQWMWKFQHPNGGREINTLHVPMGQAVELTMISEDVIHSLFVPAFRVKHDVLPGSYSRLWFNANKTGEFHLFCAEYCGTDHSRMIGKVVVMQPAEYEAWLSGGKVNESPAVAGKRLFEELRCATCHTPGQGQPVLTCPPLTNVYGHEVQLTTGSKVMADEDYLRESILRPRAKVVAGFQPLMPTYEGQVDEEQLMQLLVYIKSLSTHPSAQ